MSIRAVDELLCLCLMHRWQTTAPPDRHTGYLDGEARENCQAVRLAYVLQKMQIVRGKGLLADLQKRTVRRDAGSLVSPDPHQLHNPIPVSPGWYVEGCTSLEQKRKVVRELRQLGLTPAFVDAVEAFVANDPVERYFPDLAELDAIFERAGIHRTQ